MHLKSNNFNLEHSVIQYPIFNMKTLYLIVLSFYLIAPLYGQKYNFKNYRAEEEFGQNQIISIYQDYYGFIWLGAGGGLTRYDGENWLRFRIQDGLPDNQILTITGSDSSFIWVGTTNGIARVNISNTTAPFIDSVYQVPKTPFKDISILLAGSNNTLWIGTRYQGLYFLKNGKIKAHKINNILSSQRIVDLVSGQNELYVVTKMEIFCLDLINKKLKYTIKNNALRFLTLYPLENDNKLIIGTVSGVYSYSHSDNKFTAYLPPPYTNKDYYIFKIQKDLDDRIWIVTDKGIFKISSQGVELINHKNGLPADGMRTIFIDWENNYWFGSINSGLCKLSNSEIYSYDRDSGLKSGVVNSICKEADDLILLGSDDGIYKVYKKELKKDERFKSIADKIIWHVYKDRKGRIWAGGEGILAVYEKGRLISAPYKQIVDENIVFDILQDRSGVYWFATQNGLYQMKGDNIKQLPMPDSAIKSALDVEELRNGRIAVATDNGLLIYNGDNYTYHNKQSGLPVNSIYVIYESRDGTLWLGTDLGVIRFKNNQFKIFAEDAGLHGTIIADIIEDKDGNLWLGSEEGLEKFTNSRVTKFISVKDGLAGNEFTTQHSIIADKRGYFWLGLFGGLTVLQPDKLLDNSVEPPIYFSVADYYENGKQGISFLFDDDVQIPFSHNNINFDFTGLYFYNEHRLSYSYQLEGIDDAPKTIGRAGNVRYSNLWPGEYTLNLQAQIDGNPIGQTIRKNFVILKPFWLQWYFYLFIVLLLAFIIYQFYRYKINRIYKRNEELENKIHERTQELALTKANIEKIIENAGSAIVTVDENNKITTWNKKAEEVFKYSKDEMLNSKLNLLDRKDDAMPFSKIIEEVRKNGTLSQIEMHKNNKDKEDIELILTATPIINADGSIQMITFAMEDFSERNKLIDAMVNREKMLAAIEAMNRLMATLSHYLNNALMSITLLAELSQMDKNHMEKLLTTIGVQSARITGMLKSLGKLISDVKLKTRDYAGEEGKIFDIEQEINDFVNTIKSGKEQN